MTMTYRETTALLHEAESRDNLAAGLKGGKAAEEFRREREALEKAIGGKKTLEQADKYYDDCVVKGDKHLAREQAKAAVIVNDAKKVTAEINQRMATLGESEQSLNERNARADVDEVALREREKTLLVRERHVTVREDAAKEAEAARVSAEKVLQSTQARLTSREQTLDARDARVRAAVA